MNYTNPEIIPFNELGLDLAFQLFPSIQPKYGNITISQNNFVNELDPATGVTLPKEYVTPLEYSLCGSNGTYYNYSDQEMQDLFAVDQYFCIKNKSAISFAGTFLSDLWRLIIIEIYPC